MSNENKQPLDAAVEAPLEQAHQAIEQTRAEIARSQALSQAEADLAQAIGRIAEEQADPTDEQSGSDEHQPFAQNKSKDTCGAAAERDTYSDFFPALCDEIGEHAVDANRRQEQRDEPKREREQRR